MQLFQLNRNRIYSYKEACQDSCSAISAISDVLYVKFDQDVDIKEACLCHLPIINDIDDVDSELVVFKIRQDGTVSIAPAKSAVKCESTSTCYTFSVSEFNG